MNPTDPLASLHALRTPEPISWWPLAPGWWLLIVLALALITGACLLLWRQYRANAYRRKALKALASAQQNWQQQGDNTALLQQINALLKATAIKAFPPTQCAALYGDNWLNFLQQTLPDNTPPSALGNSVYGPTPEFDSQALHHFASLWIRKHRRQP